MFFSTKITPSIAPFSERVDATMQFVHVPCTALIEIPHGVIRPQDVRLNLLVRVVIRQVMKHFFVLCHNHFF